MSELATHHFFTCPNCGERTQLVILRLKLDRAWPDSTAGDTAHGCPACGDVFHMHTDPVSHRFTGEITRVAPADLVDPWP